MKYCSECGAEVVIAVPEGDHRERHICQSCDTVHYQNPKIVTGCLVEHENKILMCKRGIEPRYGLWTLPAGFMENQETIAEGAVRETYEEAVADVSITGLFAVYDIPYISQVYTIYRATLNSEYFSTSPESLEVKLVDPADIPWGQLAFAVIKQVLIDYLEDLKTGEFRLHTGIITPEMKQTLHIRPEGY